jgi:protein-S-isoprenylcysteine O-methyltransferase Ste14
MKAPRLINSVPDLTLVLTLLMAFGLDRFSPVVRIIPYPVNLVGWPMIGVGVVGITLVMTTLRRHRTSTNPADMPTSFLTSGVFSISRNPLYLSYVIVVLGAALLFGSLAAFLAPLLCFLVIHLAIVPIEERRLNEGLGSAYQTYCANVRRWI